MQNCLYLDLVPWNTIKTTYRWQDWITSAAGNGKNHSDVDTSTEIWVFASFGALNFKKNPMRHLYYPSLPGEETAVFFFLFKPQNFNVLLER